MNSDGNANHVAITCLKVARMRRKNDGDGSLDELLEKEIVLHM